MSGTLPETAHLAVLKVDCIDTADILKASVLPAF